MFRLGARTHADLLDREAISCSLILRPYPVRRTGYQGLNLLLRIILSVKIRPQRQCPHSDISGLRCLEASSGHPQGLFAFGTSKTGTYLVKKTACKADRNLRLLAPLRVSETSEETGTYCTYWYFRFRTARRVSGVSSFEGGKVLPEMGN